MPPMVLLLVVLGVGYVSKLLTRFLIWLDGADKPEEDVPAAQDKAPAGPSRRAA